MKTLETIAKFIFLSAITFAIWDWSILGLKLIGTSFILWFLVNYYKMKDQPKRERLSKEEREIRRILDSE